MTEQTATQQAEDEQPQDAVHEPEDYYCGIHGFVPISHFPCPGKE